MVAGRGKMTDRRTREIIRQRKRWSEEEKVKEIIGFEGRRKEGRLWWKKDRVEQKKKEKEDMTVVKERMYKEKNSKREKD